MPDTDQHAHEQAATRPLLQSVVVMLRQAVDEVDEAQRRIGETHGSPGDEDRRAVARLLESVRGNLMDTVIGLQLMQRRQGAHSTGNYPSTNDAGSGSRRTADQTEWVDPKPDAESQTNGTQGPEE